MTVTLRDCPALVLNADFRPLSYYPLSLWGWQDAIKAVICERVIVVSEYDQHIHSPTISMALPSVISLREYIAPGQKPAFTRFNLFLRDLLICQYCGQSFPAHELTFDHVIPKAQGGRTNWKNVVAACSPCNLKKGGRTPEQANMPLYRQPHVPTTWELLENGRGFPPNFLHESWRDFLYWDTELSEG